MPQPTFFVPVAFARTTADLGWIGVPQDPQSTGDAPTTTTTAPTGGDQTTSQTQVDPNAPKPQPQGPCADPMMMWMLPAMLLVMWLFVMRPEQKRRKEQQALLSSIKVDDKVVTAGGMHGTVARLTDKTVTLRVGNTEITFDRTAIARVDRGDGAAKNG